MAQIAGLAGRHQRDGSVGSVTAEGPGAFTPEEIAAIEGHHFPRLEAVYWREGSPDFASVAALIGSLDTRPDHIRLRAAAQALDLTLLKRLPDAPWVRDRGRAPAVVARRWAACGAPDFRKVGEIGRAAGGESG